MVIVCHCFSLPPGVMSNWRNESRRLPSSTRGYVSVLSAIIPELIVTIPSCNCRIIAASNGQLLVRAFQHARTCAKISHRTRCAEIKEGVLTPSRADSTARMVLHWWRSTNGAAQMVWCRWRCADSVVPMALHGQRGTNGAAWVARHLCCRFNEIG